MSIFQRLRNTIIGIHGIPVIGVIAGITLSTAIIGCDNNQVAPGVNPPNHYFPKVVANYDSLRNECSAIALNLATSNTWITPTVRTQIMDAGVPLSQISSTLPATLTMGNRDISHKDSMTIVVDSVTYEVRIELLNPGKASMLSPTATNYGVIIDPDRFYDRDGANGGSYNVTTVKFTTLGLVTTTVLLQHPGVSETDRQAAIDDITYPVFVVAIEEQSTDVAVAGTRPVNAPGKLATSKYVVLNQLTLRTKLDNSNEEFELYMGDGEFSNINSTTPYKFDGGNHTDAKGVSRNFKDVNDKSTYTMNADIYLHDLTSTIVRMAAIEDDDDAGYLDRSTRSNTESQSITAYRCASNTKVTSDWTFNTPWNVGFFNDQDDYYTSSGVDKINETNLNARLGVRSYFDTDESTNGTLGDIKWKLGMKQ